MNCISEKKAEPKAKRLFEETEVLYLRKANQIHKYFVDKFADGNDDCKPIYIELDDLKELKAICEQIIKESSLAVNILKGGWGSIFQKKDKKVKLGKPDYEEKTFRPLEEKCLSELKAGDCYFANEGNTLRYIEEIEDKGDEVRIAYQELYLGKEIEDKSLAEKLLPTQEGFFFGSTDYDEWYLADLKSYIEQVDEIIKDHQALIGSGVKDWDIDYYYQASW